MSRSAYVLGRQCEYLACRHLEKLGWKVQRMAGSHSPVDIFAWKPGAIMLVQIKNRRMGPKERATALEELAEMPSLPGLTRELWERHERAWIVTVV